MLALALVFGLAAFAFAAPNVPLLYGAIVLGVPHLARELSIFDLRRSLWIHIPLLVIAAAILKEPRLELALAASAIIFAKPPRAIAIAALGAAVAAIGSLTFATAARDSVITLHGFITIAIWIFAFQRPKRAAIPALCATLAAFSALAVLHGPLVAQVFLQLVHYAVWLILIPRRRPKAFPWTLAIFGTAIVIAAAIVLGPERARDEYLVLARFHIWLELAIAAGMLGKK